MFVVSLEVIEVDESINGNKLSSGRNKCAEVMINTTPRTFENVQVREEMKIQI